ncbi:TonB-dependent receptor plug domain-containing protein [Pseudoduganella sp. RAF19]|uniref:TonB-dependent receptor plug domain-containing protein n=2 Tax=unclassified Pseudoduganella TaxID=2637179 RepID=UPI003F9C2571
MKKKILPLSLLLAFGAAQAADEAPAAAEKVLPQVEVKGSAALEARRNDTATKIVVTQEEILKNGDTSIGEVLKRLPGITIGGVQGRGGDIRMRGLGSGYTSIMLNGEPAPPGFSLDSLTPDMIERIEIMRAATAEFSTQAIAGGINIVLKRTVHTGQTELKAGMQSENDHQGGSVTLQLSDRKGPWSYAIGGGVIDSRFSRPSQTLTEGEDASGKSNLRREGQDTSFGNFRQLNLSPRVNYAVGPGDVITSQTFINVNRFSVDNAEHIDTVYGALPPYSATTVHVESRFEQFREDLSWARNLGEGRKLDMKLGANYNHRSTTAPSAQYWADGTLALDRLISSGSTDKGFTSTGKYSTPLFTGHSLAMGWDVGYSKRNEARIQRESSTVGARAENLDQFYDADVRRAAFFAQDEWNVTDRWSVYVGTRWEGIEVKSTGNDYAPVDNKFNVLSPLFQTLYKLGEQKKDQVRLGVTRTYKAPGVGDLIPRRFASNNNTATSPDQMGNPDLKPELAWGLDLAFEHYLGDGGLLSASTFMRRIDDITHRRVDFMNGLWVSRPVNDGVANTHGVELEAKLPLRALMKTAPAVEMRANLSRNWSTLDSVPGPNNRLDQQTPLSGTVGADWKLDKLSLTAGGSFSFQSGGPVRISDQQYAFSSAKRALDLYALWKFTPKQQLRVSMSNALHQDNVAQSSYADTFGALHDTTITPTFAQFRALLEIKL